MSITVGIWIPKGKKARIKLPQTIDALCIKANIKIVEIDPDKDLESQGPFDLILHKVLDYLKEVDTAEANRRINRFISFTERNPDIVLIDNLKWCWKLTNRRCMTEVINACQFKMKGIKVFLPNTLDVTEGMSHYDIAEEISKNDVKFPVISKSYSAYFGDGAHEMAVLFSSEGLESLKPPCLIQEFTNHGGLLYKVFVVGKRFKICERPSIKNFYREISTNKTLHFDSFRVSKTGQAYMEDLHSTDPNKRKWRNCNELPDMLDYDIVSEIVSRIHTCTGLYLFGFDILVEEKTGNYAMIDINRFPSYAGIGDEYFPKYLVELLKSF